MSHRHLAMYALQSEVVAVAVAADDPAAPVVHTADVAGTIRLSGSAETRFFPGVPPKIPDAKPPARASDGDYGLVLVPFVIGTGVFAVVVAFANPTSGVIWALAAAVITTVLMRDDDFSALVARFASYLRGE